jgi:hypothetical protein
MTGSERSGEAGYQVAQQFCQSTDERSEEGA